MKRLPHPALFLIAGLGVAQILFFIIVFHSDRMLYQTMTVLSHAGYLTVPNALVLPVLQKATTAFCGGLFFTLTVGAGLCLLALFAAWIVYRLHSGDPPVVIAFVVLWIILIALFNTHGFNPMVTAAAVLVPFCVFILYRHWLIRSEKKFDWISGTAHLVVILLLLGVGSSVANRDIFINIRDYLLLSNPVGEKVNAFYYRYTLYPAEVFKTMDQKLIKTCTIDNSGALDPHMVETLESTLRRYDYLQIGTGHPVDMSVKLDRSSLVFSHSGAPVETTTFFRFISAPGSVLHKFSIRCDINGFFRHFTFYSLLIALPLLLYICLHGLFSLFFGIAPAGWLRSVIPSSLCLAFGLLFVLALYRLPTGNIPVNMINQKLGASDWQDRRAALKTITDMGYDPLQFHIDPDLMKSPHTPVRYWLASALGNSRAPEAYNMLIKLTSDPQPNVKCMAYYGLGNLGDPRAISAIHRRLPHIKQAYTQWYAYKALKRLGWIQSSTTSHPLQ